MIRLLLALGRRPHPAHRAVTALVDRGAAFEVALPAARAARWLDLMDDIGALHRPAPPRH